MPTAPGVVFSTHDGSLQYLPLDKVIVDALVVDLSARVEVIQRFYNPSPDATPRAKYVFPIPAKAAICGFEMHTADSGVLLGKVKERLAAQAQHERDLQEGKKTALLDHSTDDVFVTSIGPVPGNESITIVTTYVMDLMHDSLGPSVRFYVPMSVGQRYGPIPSGMEDASSPAADTKISFNIRIQMQGSIQLVSCPSHEGLVVQPHKSRSGKNSKRRMVARLRSKDFLFQDFVLLIKAEGLDEPRCLAEFSNQGRSSVALQLTLYPKFELPPRTQQEFIFLVDRSGSMSLSQRIDIAKQTLSRLLRILPKEGTTFNVFSFGSKCEGHWSRSEIYSDDTLNNMIHHVMSMEADLGGTEIYGALNVTLSSRSFDVPTAVFVLTDGEATDVDNVRLLVKQAVSSSRSNAPLRVSTLAIGEQVSTDMCQAIAEAGNGECLMATAAESIFHKCAALVHAGTTFTLKDIWIHWGLPAELLRSDAPNRSANLLVDGKVLWQSPSTIPTLSPGRRFTVFALLGGDLSTLPDKVILHAKRDGTGPPLEFAIPVQQVKFETQNTHARLLHTLAARQMISELQGSMVYRTIDEDTAKASIISLGEQYQLASRFTSFVTEDLDDPSQTSQTLRAMRHSHMKNKIEAYDMQPRGRGHLERLVRTAVVYASALTSAFTQAWFGPPIPSRGAPPTPTPDSHTMTGYPRDEGQSRIVESDSMHNERTEGYGLQQEEDDGYSSDGTFTTLSSLISTVDSSCDCGETRPPSPVIEEDDQMYPAIIQRQPSPPPPPLEPAVFALMDTIHADGSFVINQQLEESVGRAAIEEGQTLQTDPQLWATALAIAYFEKKLVSDLVLLETFVDKAKEYGRVYNASRQAGSLTFDELLAKARAVLTS